MSGGRRLSSANRLRTSDSLVCEPQAERIYAPVDEILRPREARLRDHQRCHAVHSCPERTRDGERVTRSEYLRVHAAFDGRNKVIEARQSLEAFEVGLAVRRELLA